MSILTNFVLGKSLDNFSKTGAIILQGGHQVAVKYRTLLSEDSTIPFNADESPSTTKLALVLASRRCKGALERRIREDRRNRFIFFPIIPKENGFDCGSIALEANKLQVTLKQDSEG